MKALANKWVIVVSGVRWQGGWQGGIGSWGARMGQAEQTDKIRTTQRSRPSQPTGPLPCLQHVEHLPKLRVLGRPADERPPTAPADQRTEEGHVLTVGQIHDLPAAGGQG